MRANGSDLMFDPFKPGPRDQLPQVLAELRERFPVYRTSSDIWVVSRFDDVKAVQSNPQQFSSRPNPYEGSAPPDDEISARQRARTPQGPPTLEAAALERD